MAFSRLTTTYYRVTWSGTSVSEGPDYNALTGDQAGGVDNCAPEKYLRIVRAIGAQAAVADGDTIQINGAQVQFTTAGGLNLAGIINTINAGQTEHGCVATESPATYLTILNASGSEGMPITLMDITGGVVAAKLGLAEATYTHAPVQQGGAFDPSPLSLANGNNVNINGVNILFTTAGGLDLAGVISTINAQSMLTNVAAQSGGGGLVLISLNKLPFTLSAGTTAGTWADLGFTTGNKGGSVIVAEDNQTLAQSLAKERATLRWDSVVNELGQLITPVFLGEVLKTGNLNSTAPVTTLSWTVAYDRASYLNTPDELNPGVSLTGTACIRRLVARALTHTYEGNQEVFDPTLTSVGNLCTRVNPLQIKQLTSAGLDAVADLATLEANITVTQINLV
jgi:hypothetical protein